MSFGVDIILIFAAGACVLGVFVMSVRARHRSLTKRNALRGQRKFREQNAAVARRWH